LHFTASDKCHEQKRKTVNGEDILFAMSSLGFDNYAEALKIYLTKYREVSTVVPVPFGPVFPLSPQPHEGTNKSEQFN
jgi:hypothetical protein